ncbi:hypothetical protein AB0D67_08295 [Streptosporangium sp. NPDC048047]|uniref:hypothetical protein n=1 Tax=Streptosporangium sp. NPDC048047 TaxID=3155748 RepID=UPI003421E280
MSNPNRALRIIRVRWHAEQPPTPLGCRWCGHPPYAHDTHGLPHRPGHLWEQPTPAQVRARMTARRRLGLCDRPFPGTIKPTTARSSRLFHSPTGSPVSRPAMGFSTGQGRHARPAATAVTPYGRGSRPQDAYVRDSPPGPRSPC